MKEELWDKKLEPTLISPKYAQYVQFKKERYKKEQGEGGGGG